MVAAELAQQTSLEAAAQSVVDRVKRLHHDVYVSGRQRAPFCSRHEDMTLLIRTLNYPLADGALTPTQGRKGYLGIEEVLPLLFYLLFLSQRVVLLLGNVLKPVSAHEE